MPGLVRVSFGLYNRFEEIDYLVEALQRIQKGEYRGEYFQDIASGDFAPRGWQANYADYFSVEQFVH